MSADSSSQIGDMDVNIDFLGDLFYPVYKRVFGENSDFVGNVESKLKEARMKETTEYFISKGLGVGIITGIVLWVLGMITGYVIFALGVVSPETFSLGLPAPTETIKETLRSLVVPVVVVGSGVIFGVIGFVAGFGGYVGVPYQKANNRERNINILLPDAVSFMYALSVGGMNQLEILKAMAGTEETYGEIAKEFQSIINETEYLGEDYRNAIRTQSLETPSDPLAQFFTDMLSIIDSGGDIESFLEDKKELYMKTAKQEQEKTLETLELFGQMYMTLSIFPLLLLIVLVVMGIMGQVQEQTLYMVVYGLTPGISIVFLILVAGVKRDDPGDGYLTTDEGDIAGKSDIIDTTQVDEYTDSGSVFDSIRKKQRQYEVAEILTAPHVFFKNYPVFTLFITIPIVLVLFVAGVMQGLVPTTHAGLKDQVVWGTLFWVYIPGYIVLIPLTVFYEWNVRSRKSITGKLSETLRKMASANDTGQTLQESIYTVASTATGNLAHELGVINSKINYGVSVKQALIEFNNKYYIPRMSRTIKLIVEAQETTNEISDVLITAARASEITDDIERERKKRTRMQIAIILMTFFTLLGVMALIQSEFITVMVEITGGASGNSGGGGAGSAVTGLDGGMLSMLFFHAVTLQAILAGYIAGFIRTGEVLSGSKYVVALLTAALIVWSVV